MTKPLKPLLSPFCQFALVQLRSPRKAWCFETWVPRSQVPRRSSAGVGSQHSSVVEHRQEVFEHVHAMCASCQSHHCACWCDRFRLVLSSLHRSDRLSYRSCRSCSITCLRRAPAIRLPGMSSNRRLFLFWSANWPAGTRTTRYTRFCTRRTS